MRLWMNSKYVTKGDYFLVNKENEGYVYDAIKNGASKIICDTNKTYEITTKKVNNVYDYIASFYKDKIDELKLIGVTGTNGKTTTCYLIYQMLNSIGVKTSYIGTIGFYLNDKVKSLNNTTPSIDVLYNLLLDSYNAGCKVVVMEVSSHALRQDRVHGLLFDAVIITNVTEEHQDYHKNMKDYINSKRKIIYMLKNNKICILNKKDKHYKKFINKSNRNVIIGKDIKIKKYKIELEKTNVTIKCKKKINLELSLLGDFNIYNYVMAYVALKELGYNNDKFIKASYNYKAPIGRMQKVKYKNNAIFIDYAHTPDAVLNVLKTVRKINSDGVITIIGCGGDRDKEKREKMGSISCVYSNYVIFTLDNPRGEDPKSIVNDMLKGAFGKYEVILDRKKAIEKGISLLNGNKILMILGKGHENYQIIKGVKHHFSDLEEVMNIILKK